MSLDLAELRDVGRAGRATLEARVKLLCDAVAADEKRLDEIGQALTRVQARFTELLLENRQLRAEAGASSSDAIVPASLSEPMLPHWICPICKCFNGEAKERLEKCRACEGARP